MLNGELLYEGKRLGHVQKYQDRASRGTAWVWDKQISVTAVALRGTAEHQNMLEFRASLRGSLEHKLRTGLLVVHVRPRDPTQTKAAREVALVLDRIAGDGDGVGVYVISNIFVDGPTGMTLTIEGPEVERS